MPKGSKKEALEKRLRAQGKKKGLSGDRLNAYIYGTLTKVMGPGGAKKASKTGKVRSKKTRSRKRK
mgnify:FL=1|tara:strand:+ start:519 stop:716 length:198 start_codon:yes stop_codon:yes gene_type:complete